MMMNSYTEWFFNKKSDVKTQCPRRGVQRLINARKGWARRPINTTESTEPAFKFDIASIRFPLFEDEPDMPTKRADFESGDVFVISAGTWAWIRSHSQSGMSALIVKNVWGKVEESVVEGFVIPPNAVYIGWCHYNPYKNMVSLASFLLDTVTKEHPAYELTWIQK